MGILGIGIAALFGILIFASRQARVVGVFAVLGLIGLMWHMHATQETSRVKPDLTSVATR
jgi:uncharacterized membrane protein